MSKVRHTCHPSSLKTDIVNKIKERGFSMTIKTARVLQILSLVVSAIATALCVVVAIQPKWIGITNIDIKIIPIASLVSSAGSVIIGLFYLVMLIRAKSPASKKAAIIITALSLCTMTVVIEPAIHFKEFQLFQTTQLHVESTDVLIAIIEVKQGLREVIRLILYISGALSFLSMGGFWEKKEREDYYEIRT